MPQRRSANANATSAPALDVKRLDLEHGAGCLQLKEAVRVLIVEPGAFRTGLHRTGSRRETTALPAYEQVVGPTREQQAGFDGRQPGDPARAAAAILEVVAAEDAPLRLVLGSDAAAAIGDSRDASRAELTKWETLTRSTDFPT